MKIMPNEVYISLYLDVRRKKKTGKYPVKLRVFCSKPRRKQTLYKIPDLDYSKEEFKAVWKVRKVKTIHKAERAKLEAIIKRAEAVRDSMQVFTFAEFKTKLWRRSEKLTIADFYKAKIKELTAQGRIGTANTYQNGLTSFIKHDQRFAQYYFHEVGAKWLKSYVEGSSNSVTTIGIYLRALRAAYNEAIADGMLDAEYYPFAKDRHSKLFRIPKPAKGSTRGKLALTIDQLRSLWNANPDTETQALCKDLWFFSFNAQGMNIKDIINLKWTDLSDESFSFVREKTKRTKLGDRTIVYMNAYLKSIIDKYAAKGSFYVFPFLTDKMSAEVAHKTSKRLTRLINSQMKLLCEANDLPVVTTYVARHSFASKAIHDGMGIRYVKEALNHESEAVTEGYIKSLRGKETRAYADRIMDFSREEE